jgi:hypothetical protein
MMPHCDIENGKIFGCLPKTFSWFHEEGHLIYNSEEKTSRLNLFRGMIFDLWVVLITGAFFSIICRYLSVTAMLGYVALGQYEELWCNRYARKKLKELKDGME